MLQNKEGRDEELMTSSMVATKGEVSDSEGNVEEEESDSSSNRGRASKGNPQRTQAPNNKKMRLKEEDGKKNIMVGGDFQAIIPDGLCQYGDALPYENEDKLVWDPSYMSPKEVDEYLAKIQMPNLINNNNKGGVHDIPQGLHTRDDEQALYTLLQCGYNMEEALRRCRLNPCSNESMSLWSEEECSHFESGLRVHGKDFHLIQMNKVKTRSVAELVHFYYLWKKTERHDIFANKARLLKKKYGLLQGFNDYMDRFLDEQEGCPNREHSSSPSNYMSA